LREPYVGRTYSDTNSAAANITKLYRNYIYGSNYYDVDMNKAHPSILSNLVLKFGLNRLTKLITFPEKRDWFINTMIESVGKKNISDLDNFRSEEKKNFTKLLFQSRHMSRHDKKLPAEIKS
jgi:hypothetical protein